MSTIVIVTDTWHPQINGVVRAIDATKHILEMRGFEVRIIHQIGRAHV